MSYFIDSSGSLRCSHEICGDLWNTSSTSPLVDHFSSIHLNFLCYETGMLKTIVLLNSSLVPRAWQGLWGWSQEQRQSRGATCGSEQGSGYQGSSWVGNGATSTAERRCWAADACSALCLLCPHFQKLHWMLQWSLHGAGAPQSLGAVLCFRSGCYACNLLLCIHSRSSRQPGPLSPWVLPPEMEPLSPENRAMWQCSQTLAHNSSNLQAADCCSAINTPRAINKHYLSALVFVMLGHCALACGATGRLKAGFRDEHKLLRGSPLCSLCLLQGGRSLLSLVY